MSRKSKYTTWRIFHCVYLWLLQLVCETPSGVGESWDCKAQKGHLWPAGVVVVGTGWPMALEQHDGWGWVLPHTNAESCLSLSASQRNKPRDCGDLPHEVGELFFIYFSLFCGFLFQEGIQMWSEVLYLLFQAATALLACPKDSDSCSPCTQGHTFHQTQHSIPACPITKLSPLGQTSQHLKYWSNTAVWKIPVFEELLKCSLFCQGVNACAGGKPSLTSIYYWKWAYLFVC